MELRGAGRRGTAAVLAGLALAATACGGGEEDEGGGAGKPARTASTIASAGANADADAVVACLKASGVAAKGPFRPLPDDDDAPDRGEVILPGAMLAFYSSAGLAERRARSVLPKDGSTMNGLKVRVLRRGRVSALIFDPVHRTAIEGCLSA